ncbi:MAG: helix-turn-helix domain-containing protein [Synergistaceae bacterium]|jgi:transcriptional regulator with XRE-family HTH domain|nr:helix-turn-helix domain-containing protein [Synergistaceae bacterium]
MFLVPRMKERRKVSRLTQPELATLVKVSAKTVGRWESGERKPDTDEAARIAASLNTSVAYLLGETDDPAPPRLGDLAIETINYGDSKNCLVENISNNNNGVANASLQIKMPPENIVIQLGDLHMEFPKGTPADVISAAIESARKGG